MKSVLLLVFLPAAAVCQFPVQLNATVTHAPDYMGQFYQSLRDGAQVAQNGARLALQEESLAVQRERLRFEESRAGAQQASKSPSTYRDVYPRVATWRLNQDVKDAIATCKAIHEDCGKLDGLMNVIAGAIQPDWKQLTMKEYIECVYVIAKHASFGEQARAMLDATPPALKLP